MQPVRPFFGSPQMLHHSHPPLLARSSAAFLSLLSCFSFWRRRNSMAGRYKSIAAPITISASSQLSLLNDFSRSEPRSIWQWSHYITDNNFHICAVSVWCQDCVAPADKSWTALSYTPDYCSAWPHQEGKQGMYDRLLLEVMTESQAYCANHQYEQIKTLLLSGVSSI